MKRKDISVALQEIYLVIEGSLDSIIQDILPLEYDKQKDVISYIAEQLASNSLIEKRQDFPELDEEIDEINNAIGEMKNLHKQENFTQEEQKNIYAQTAELIKKDILSTVGPSTELEKKYFDKLSQVTVLEEKNILIKEYKLSLQDLNKKNIQNLQKQQHDLRGGKEITNVEEHKLVKEEIVTKEEIEPYLSNYELLNTLGECSNLTDEKNTSLVKKLFEIARNFYPNNSSQGLKELMELPYQKVSDVLGENILELLNTEQISFADIHYIESRELHRINKIDIESNFKLIECVIAGGCPLTLRKLIEDNKIGSFSKKELDLVVALFEKDSEALSKFKGMKLSNEVSKLLLTFSESLAYKLDDLISFINIKDLEKEVFLVAALHHMKDIMHKLIEEKIDFSSETLIKALELNFDDIEIFNYLLNFEKLNINTRNEKGHTLLHLAINEEKPEIIEILLSHPNIDVNENTPLYNAIIKDEPEIVKVLLSHKDIDINEKDQSGSTILDYVSFCDKLEQVEDLLSHPDIKVNEKNQFGDTVLHSAITHGKLAIVEKLLSHKDVDINEKKSAW